jgi:protein-S-isoprenylcysteine O-methyltransferase Ste14
VPGEEEVPKMRIFRGFAILFTVALISLGIFILYDSMARRSAAASDSVIAGAVLFSLALTLLYFISRPTVK